MVNEVTRMGPNPMWLMFLGDQDTEGQPCEDTGRRSSTHQGERPKENQPCLHLDPGLGDNKCHLSPQAVAFVRQPEATETEPVGLYLSLQAKHTWARALSCPAWPGEYLTCSMCSGSRML